MKNTTKLSLAAAALTGLLAGATARAATPVLLTHSSAKTTLTKASVAGQHAIKLDDSTDKHDCKGKNDCKGKGGCKTGDQSCKGKNSCKGKGGCKTNGDAAESSNSPLVFSCREAGPFGSASRSVFSFKEVKRIHRRDAETAEKTRRI